MLTWLQWHRRLLIFYSKDFLVVNIEDIDTNKSLLHLLTKEFFFLISLEFYKIFKLIPLKE